MQFIQHGNRFKASSFSAEGLIGELRLDFLKQTKQVEKKVLSPWIGNDMHPGMSWNEYFYCLNPASVALYIPAQQTHRIDE